MTRMPVVAGRFYEGTEETLMPRLKDSFLKGLGPGRLPDGPPGEKNEIKALIAPHAGYVYSGMTAAHSYISLFEDKVPEHLVILGPNHTGVGKTVAVCEEDWKTPLGLVSHDTELGQAIIKEDKYAESDCIAHNSEHSIEVQLPFLQYIYGGLSFVPICLGTQRYEICESLGLTLAKLAEEMDITVIASSDFTHFEPADTAAKKDNQAMEYLEFLDGKGFIEFVKSHKVSICGAAPITVATVFAKEMGATRFNLLKYTNSGDITGNKNDVVAYVAAEYV